MSGGERQESLLALQATLLSRDKVRRPCLLSAQMQAPCCLRSLQLQECGQVQSMTRPPDARANQFFRSKGGHCGAIFTDSEEENGEAGCNKIKGSHGVSPAQPAHGCTPKNESARNAAKCGAAQRREQGDGRLSPEMNLNWASAISAISQHSAAHQISIPEPLLT